MADFTSVPTVELLTRAADAAGRAAAAALCVRGCDWAELPKRLGTRLDERRIRLIAASGPDHWRAVELTFRRALERAETLNRPMALGDLRPLAKQVLRDLGDTP